MRVRIEFPEEMAAQKVEEAREWEPGKPLVWEASEYNVSERIRKHGDKIIIKTEWLEVELTPEEIDKICGL